MTPEASDANAPGLRSAAAVLGDSEALYLLASLVSIAPTNLEDPVHGRWEKPCITFAPKSMSSHPNGARLGFFHPNLRPGVGDPDSPYRVSGDTPPERHHRPRRRARRSACSSWPTSMWCPCQTEQLARWSSPPQYSHPACPGRSTIRTGLER